MTRDESNWGRDLPFDENEAQQSIDAAQAEVIYSINIIEQQLIELRDRLQALRKAVPDKSVVYVTRPYTRIDTPQAFKQATEAGHYVEAKTGRNGYCFLRRQTKSPAAWQDLVEAFADELKEAKDIMTKFKGEAEE